MITLDSGGAAIHSSVKLVTAPATPLIALQQFKRQAGIYHSDFDGLLEEYLETAREVVERRTNRVCVNATYDVMYDAVSGSRWLTLPLAPLVSITSITSYALDATATVATASDYFADTFSTPGRIGLTQSATWPTGLRPLNAVVVRAVFGYGTDPADTPASLKHAVRMLATHYFEQPSASREAEGQAPQLVPEGVERLLSAYALVAL